jgi:hypothetical protein
MYIPGQWNERGGEERIALVRSIIESSSTTTGINPVALHFLPSVNARMLSSSTQSPVSRALAQKFDPAGWGWGCADVCTSLTSCAFAALPLCTVNGGSTSTTRTTAVPSNTRRTLSASQAGARGLVPGPAAPAVAWDEKEDDEPEEEEPENACQNALPRRCVSVCEAIDASAACCGVGDDEPSFGEGGVGYRDVREDGIVWCLPLREEKVVEGLRMVAAEEK